MWTSQRACLPGKFGATETAGLGLRSTEQVSPLSTREERGWRTLCTCPQRLTAAAVCGDSAERRSWSPLPCPPPGSAAAGSRPAHEPLLPARPRNRALPSAPVPVPPALLGDHRSYGCLGGAATGAQGRAGGSAGEMLMPRTGCFRGRSRAPFCFVVPPTRTNVGVRGGQSHFSQTHLCFLRMFPEKAAGRRPDPQWVVDRTAQARLLLR